MAPGLAEDLQKEVGGAVRDLGLAVEVGVGIHIDRDAHAARDPVQVAVQRRAQVGDDVERREARGLPALV